MSPSNHSLLFYSRVFALGVTIAFGDKSTNEADIMQFLELGMERGIAKNNRIMILRIKVYIKGYSNCLSSNYYERIIFI